MATSTTSSGSSVSAFLWSLVINGLIFLVFFVGFLLLRKKYKRIYEPRTFIGTIPEEKRTEPLPAAKFGWIMPLLKSPDPLIIDKSGLDGYFFLRYLRMMMIVFSVGVCMTFPILLPINATGGGGQTGLDILSFSNISATNKNRYYAHVFVGWLFLGFVLWYLTRELLLFKKIRQEYLRRPEVASQMASRTILLTAIPKDMLSVGKLTEIFGSSVEKVWINRNHKKLQKLVDKRNKDANILENSETKIIKKVNKIAIKKGRKEVPENHEGTSTSLYIPDKKRPHHKLGYPVISMLIGKKVDSINWTRTELARLNPEIVEKQNDRESYKEQPSAFITFKTLAAAHRAAQLKLPEKKHIPFKLERTLAPKPAEVIWSNMGISFPERIGRFAATTAFVTVMIIFWAIPVAFVGSISNINYLTNKLPWLDWINDIPPVILGAITGLLPSILLALLMALLPIILRLMAKWGGVPTLSRVELFVQNTYFLFQVIQVFLVTALASSASSVVTKIISDPGSATNLLAGNLPKSSNFYICYLLLQGLAIAGGAFLQIVGLILFYVLGKLFDNTPRKMWTRWNMLSGLGWGTVFPIYTNLAVIAITYSLISPLILIFAALAFLVLYFAYLYNFLYVYNQSIDTGGMVFPRAIWQSFTGIYILEVCLTGLFGIATAYPELALFAITIPITAVYQILLQWKIENKLEYLDVTEADDLEAGEDHHTVKGSPTEEKNQPILDSGRATPDNAVNGHDTSDATKSGGAKGTGIQGTGAQGGTGVQGTGAGAATGGGGQAGSATNQAIDAGAQALSVQDSKGPARGKSGMNDYYHPAVTAPVPVIWIPEDPLGISKEEIRDTEAAGDIKITDGGASLDEKNKLTWNEDPPDYEP